MPPTIGTAMRRISSEPVPVPHRIGKSPAMMAIPLIIFARTRLAAPATIARSRSASSANALLRRNERRAAAPRQGTAALYVPASIALVSFIEHGFQDRGRGTHR